MLMQFHAAISVNLCQIVCMRILILLCLMSASVAAKTIELGFPELKHRVKVALPDGHDPSKKYPAIFYYHGTGGTPDTSLIKHHIGNEAWIVVGMSYFQLGQFNMSREAMAKELTLLRSVKRHLQVKYGMDPAKCYVAGFSKGGWMADMLLQADTSLAGGVILGAGHLHKYHKTPIKYAKKKPVFIGVGRMDNNYPFALRGVLHHRKMGGQVTMEEWAALAHAFPGDGSLALTQWFAVQSSVKPGHEAAIRKEMNGLLTEASKLDAVKQWNELRRIRALPYSRLLGKDWLAQLDASIKKLEAQSRVKMEARALSQHRKLLFREITERSLKDLEKINFDYINLVADYHGTLQGELADKDRQRILAQIKFLKENGEPVAEEKKKRGEPIKPEFPNDRRRIPGNPLIR